VATGVTTTQTDEDIVTFAQQDTSANTWSAGGAATFRLGDMYHIVGGQTQVVSAIQTNLVTSMVSSGTGDTCIVLTATFKASTGSAPARNRHLLGLLP
jgi:hypothetical protein